MGFGVGANYFNVPNVLIKVNLKVRVYVFTKSGVSLGVRIIFQGTLAGFWYYRKMTFMFLLEIPVW